MTSSTSITGKIAEPLKSDIGTGIVRINAKFMNKLGASYGDVVEILGKRKSAGILQKLPPGDENKEYIKIDEIIRYNLDTSIGDDVEIRKADAIFAKKVFLKPIRPLVSSAGLLDFLVQHLLNNPLLKNNTLVVDVMGNHVKFLIANTIPNGVVVVNEDTQFQISEKIAYDEKQIPNVAYKDIGGLSGTIETIREMVEIPINNPEVFDRLGIDAPKGILLYGPSGTGKTMLMQAVANESSANFISINGSEIMSKWPGETEKRLRDLFDDAWNNAPTIIFIDEIDAIATKREMYSNTLTEFEKRIVSQLLTLMDGLQKRSGVIVFGATNRPDAMDPALRRPGRFDREIEIGVPDKCSRKEIFAIHTKRMFLSDDVDIDKLSSETHGFVGADISALCREAALHTLKRVMPLLKNKKVSLSDEELSKLIVTHQDFEFALNLVNPSAMREVLVEIPNVKWGDIGGLDAAREELKEVVEWPLKYHETFAELGIKIPKGILLYGPPGCGKTLMAKAVASESSANFISISGPSLISMWLGESERAIREIFKKARQVSPSIIFFDEIDSIAGIRSSGAGDTAKMTINMVNTLLAELDGVSELKNVVVMGATNRPDLIDTALLRPGRFGKLVFIPMPDENSRKKILEVNLKGMSVSDDVNINEIISKTNNFSGADLTALCTEAGLFAVREDKFAKEIKMIHFNLALERVHPSMSDYEIKRWKKLEDFRIWRKIREEGVSYR